MKSESNSVPVSCNALTYIRHFLFFYLFIETTNGFLPCSSDTTVRHNTQLTHSTQNYTSNKGHITPNEHNANKIIQSKFHTVHIFRRIF
jgi:hypothetical protein